MRAELLQGTRLVVASHNLGKLREIADLIGPYGLEAVAAAALGVSEPEETETTFAGNARLVGHYVEVEITAAYPHSLRGRVATSDHPDTPAPALQEQT